LEQAEEEEAKKSKKAKKKKAREEEQKEAEEEPEDEETKAEREAAATKGWRTQDFYGGDDGGDASGPDSDEDLVLEEAKRLEDLRAKRLAGEVDPLAALLASSKPEAKEEAKQDTAAAPTAGSGAGAQFDAVFAAEAEHDAVKRDLTQLPETKRRGLLKSEAPELVPLLTDFRAKLQGLKEMLPLLAPQVHAHMKPTGVSYLKAKASLLLNTLANLSYYIMLRAEGGAVRSHPVISQLVWLRELHELLAPGLARAKKDWKKLRKLGLGNEVAQSDDVAPGSGPSRPPKEPEQPAKRVSLRERFQMLRSAKEAKAAEEAAEAAALEAMKQTKNMSTKDLFRLPAIKGKKGGVASDVPADLADDDPLLGGWQPTSTLAEQLLSVKQQLGERAAKAKGQSADLNVEAQPLKARQRVRESQAEVDALAGGKPPKREDDEEEDPTGEKAAERARKAKKEAAEEAKRQAIAAQQFKPEEVLEGRRATGAKILRNRGLVRQRKHSAGNARVNNRQKFEKAVKRRRGAVQDVREAAADGTYEGEATGVRTHVRKSLKLG